jgi:acyl-CoA thioester hydrolase
MGLAPESRADKRPCVSATIDTPYAGAWLGSTHHFALRGYFEDTDTAGIVYYANYLKYMERARSDMLRAAGIDQRAALESGEGVYVVAEAHIKYRAPARLDDDLRVLSEVREVRAASCVIHQRVMRGNDMLADATIIAAFLKDGRPSRQPGDWVERFKRLKGEGA